MTLPLFDLPAARAARDVAIARGVDHASTEFADRAYLAVCAVACRESEFIVDAVWMELGSVPPTHDKRAMGSVMLRAFRDRIIEPTEEFRASAQRQCHANPRRVWRSLV